MTLKPGSNTIRFTVEARASGTFPMTISVTSPDGKLAFGAPVRVTVRSAVFGGWAVGRHRRRARLPRRLVGEPLPADAPEPAPRAVAGTRAGARARARERAR